jgi:hypothetical protein
MAPPRALIKNEVGWPVFATEKGSSEAKHEVVFELTSAVMKCSRFTIVNHNRLVHK